MNWEDAEKRLNQIIQTDVMVNEEWDFLATHVPFNKLSVQESGRTDARIKLLSEREVFQDLVVNPDDDHRFIIIRGDNGAGKSHLIRWIRAKIGSNDQFDREQVVFIRRIENNLQGAMRQLLDQGVVSNPEQIERFRKFIDASQARPAKELKLNIFFGFVAKIESDENGGYFSSGRKRRLASLLKSEHIQDFLLSPGGPIERFYDSIFSPHRKGAKGEIMFFAEDFIKMDEIPSELSDPRLKSEFRKITQEPEATKLAEYLNSFSESVIQNLANVVQGDMAAVIKDLRMDLKEQGKSLIVLIEDLTTFTGIQAELVNILTTPHGGEYAELCRVTSIVGITNAYYDSYFLGNFQDRVTHQVTIDQRSYDDKDTLTRLAARYINAAYLSDKEVREWYYNGARPEYLPYRTWEPDNFPWEGVREGERFFSIFPFTEDSLVRLFDNLGEGAKTPRFFLRDIIRPHMRAWFDYKLTKGLFPDQIQLQSIVADFPPAYDSRLIRSSFTEEEQNRLRSLFNLWGKNNLEAGEIDGISIIGGLPTAFFDLLGFENIKSLGIETEDGFQLDTAKIDDEIEVIRPPTPEEERLQRMLKDIRSWRQNNTQLNFSADLRQIIRDFLVDAVNWQSLGVPAYLVANELRNFRTIYLEGQSERGLSPEQALIVLSREEGYEPLIALCHWRYPARTWGFNDGPYMQYQLTKWLEDVKPMLVKKIKGLPGHTPEELMGWAVVLEYLRLGICGFLNPDLDEDELLYMMFSGQDLKVTPNRVGSDDIWNRLRERTNVSKRNVFESNRHLIANIFKPIMGTVMNTSEANYYDRQKIDLAFANLDLRSSIIERIMNKDASGLTGAAKATLEELQAILPLLENAIAQDAAEITNVIFELANKLGDDLSEGTFMRASNDGIKFLTEISYYGHFVSGEIMEGLNRLKRDRATLACSVAFALKMEESTFSERFSFLSGNPKRNLQEVLTVLEAVENVAREMKRLDAEKLAQLKKEQEKSVPDLAGLIRNGRKVLSLVKRVGGD